MPPRLPVGWPGMSPGRKPAVDLNMHRLGSRRHARCVGGDNYKIRSTRRCPCARHLRRRRHAGIRATPSRGKAGWTMPPCCWRSRSARPSSHASSARHSRRETDDHPTGMPTAHQLRKLSSRWQPGRSCTNIQNGPLNGGRPDLLAPVPAPRIREVGKPATDTGGRPMAVPFHNFRGRAFECAA